MPCEGDSSRLVFSELTNLVVVHLRKAFKFEKGYCHAFLKASHRQ